jgi:hypothetical protein
MSGTPTVVGGNATGKAVAQEYGLFGQDIPLPIQDVLHPLGFPLELATNSDDVLGAARESWQGFTPLFEEPVLRIHAVVDKKSRGPCPETVIHRARRHVVSMISDTANFAVCDLESAYSFCWFTPAAAANRPWLRYYYLDTVVYLCLWHKRLVRVHASCVARDGRGVLLCGPSGAGKSCLAYACARRGWTFITDEAISLLRGSEDLVVLGNPQCLRFRDTALELVPELRGRLAGPNAAGKMTIEVRARELTGVATASRCRAAAVVFLDRHGSGPAQLVPLAKEEAWRRLDQDLPVFDAPVHAEHQTWLRRLLEAGAYELHYCHPDSAVTALEALVR